MKWLVFALLMFPNGTEQTFFATDQLYDSRQQCIQDLQTRPTDFASGLYYYLELMYGANHGIKVSTIDCGPEDKVKITPPGTSL